MKSIALLYNIGHGPSSSHTMGPSKAAQYVLTHYPTANRFSVVLFNSLALTGVGHLTYDVLTKVLSPFPVSFSKEVNSEKHPNHLLIAAYKDDKAIGKVSFDSVGGGHLVIDGVAEIQDDVYPYDSFETIKNYCKRKRYSLIQYIELMEDENFGLYLELVWKQMKKTIEKGLKARGVLPGSLCVERRARKLFISANSIEETARETYLLAAYAFASSEENAAGSIMVTAPTCGSCGVLPAVLYYYHKVLGYSNKNIIDSLAIGGLFGNLIKENASISGAVMGCQAEIGTASAMASAAISFLEGGTLHEIEYSAEVAIEHSLGLTCDPVEGYVQIPCIERNAVFANKALSIARLSKIVAKGSKVSFDTVVSTMKETGMDLASQYRETAAGGLAKYYIKKKK